MSLKITPTLPKKIPSSATLSEKLYYSRSRCRPCQTLVFHLEVAKQPVWVTVVRKHIFQLFVKITMHLHALKSPYCFVQNKRFVLPISRYLCYVHSSSNPMSYQCTISFKATCLYHLGFWLLWKIIYSFSNNGVMNSKQLKRYNYISFSITIFQKKPWEPSVRMVNIGSGQCCIIPTQFLPSGLCELLQHNQELP